MIPKRDISELRRRERRRRKDREDRELRKMAEESRRLGHARFTADLVPLEKPYQRGWVRFFKLTDRAARRPDAELLEELLTYVNNVQYCRKRLFLEWNAEKKKQVPGRHLPKQLRADRIASLKIPERLYKYFVYKGGYKRLDGDYLRFLLERSRLSMFEVDCTHLFRTVVAPHIVTHQRKELPEVRQREDEIDAWMEANNGWKRHTRLNGHRVRKCKDGRKHLRKNEAKRQMRDAFLEFNDRCRSKPKSTETKEGTINIVPFDFYRLVSRQAA
ncbi:MAG: hypothetical protein CMO55_24625 [Verrucomicrobiales bacterium]|nr:hypothetical protein [Verrucomicrobiales bacterium]